MPRQKKNIKKITPIRQKLTETELNFSYQFSEESKITLKCTYNGEKSQSRIALVISSNEDSISITLSAQQLNAVCDILNKFRSALPSHVTFNRIEQLFISPNRRTETIEEPLEEEECLEDEIDEPYF
ncbi:MAG: hypothetical protein ACTSR3_18325 [Candidatus Helarchaeota archaeon]